MIEVKRQDGETFEDWWVRFLAERHRAEAARAKTVVCELCQRGQHRACVRPCVCRHDDNKSMTEPFFARPGSMVHRGGCEICADDGPWVAVRPCYRVPDLAN